ncbi:MAG: tyrosine-type recombinase/integrase [Actinomycetota bacterium]|nr:tyrosine-type recombinase/integrase [Actinomycetota bacterium]
MVQHGQVFKLKAKGANGQALWAYRYRLEGRGSSRPQVGGFATRAEAKRALQKVVERLGPAGRGAAMTLGDLVEEYLEMHQAEPVTIAKLRWLLGKATAVLSEVRLAELLPEQVYAWRLTVPEGHRFEATQALRQVLNRAVAWGLIDYNPAKRGVPNPVRRSKEKRPFESWQQIEAVAERLGPVYGPMMVFAAATGLRPSELFALEQRDIDRGLGVVYVRRAFANGRLKQTKTRLSTRAVPLQAIALEALDRLPASEDPILFPNSRGGHIDFRSFGRRHWKPAQVAAGIEPLRHLYDPRHTYATFALRAGVSVFAVSRFMGSSIAMIDHHYGHLARDSREHAVSLLDALAIERAVDAGWTSTPKPADRLTNSVSRPRRARSRKLVDVRWTSRAKTVANLANRRS